MQVPVLWDKREQKIVSNESADIIRMFATEFGEFHRPGATFRSRDGSLTSTQLTAARCHACCALSTRQDAAAIRAILDRMLRTSARVSETISQMYG